MGNAVSAYRLWSEVVYGVSLVGMTTVPGKYPAHGKTVCGECLNAMRKPCSQYLTQGKIGITRMTARASERRV